MRPRSPFGSRTPALTSRLQSSLACPNRRQSSRLLRATAPLPLKAPRSSWRWGVPLHTAPRSSSAQGAPCSRSSPKLQQSGPPPREAAGSSVDRGPPCSESCRELSERPPTPPEAPWSFCRAYPTVRKLPGAPNHRNCWMLVISVTAESATYQPTRPASFPKPAVGTCALILNRRLSRHVLASLTRPPAARGCP
jgi:hypothetical protein